MSTTLQYPVPSAREGSPEPVMHPTALLQGRILVLDDEPINCKIARKYLSTAGYLNCDMLTDPGEGLSMLKSNPPDILLLDICMPDISGLQVLKEVRGNSRTKRLPVLILTATSDRETKRSAMDLGATDFLSKPVDPEELVARVRNALMLKAHADQLTNHVKLLEDRVRERTSELVLTQLELVHCLGRAAEFRDTDTGDHVVRVGRYCGAIARKLELDRKFIELIEFASLLHDIGKIGIPDAILLKPGKLTEEEFDVMRSHSVIGEHVLEPLAQSDRTAFLAHTQIGARIIGTSTFELLAMARNIALTHHEKWDGTGYPRGLAGEAIPIEGRITAVADVFDALSSKRPYKPAIEFSKCLDIMRAERGKHFDPQVLDAFLQCTSEIAAICAQNRS